MEALNYTDNFTVTGSPEYKEDEDQAEVIDDVTKIIIVGAYVVILLFSFIGNSLVIHLVRTRVHVRKNPFNWLLVNTAVADLVDVITASAFSLPFYLCGYCWISGVVGTIICKIIPYFLVVSICASIWTLTVIAADRYLAIVCIRRKPLSCRSVVRSIIAVWLCSGMVFSGQLYKFKTEETEEGKAECYHEWYEESEELSKLFYKVEMIARVVITYAVPLVIMAVLYSLVAFFLRRHKPPGHVIQRAHAQQAKKRRAVIKMMMTAVTVFALCWLPVHVSHIMGEFYPESYDSIPEFLRWLFFWLAHANAAIHPWLFIVFSENLRVGTKEIFQNIWNRRRGRFQQPKFSTLSQQSLRFTTLELTASRYLAPSQSSLDTGILSLDTKF